MQIEKGRSKQFYQLVYSFVLQLLFQPISTQMASSTQSGSFVRCQRKFFFKKWFNDCLLEVSRYICCGERRVYRTGD